MKKASLTTVLLLLLVALATGAAWANDRVVSTVTYGSGPQPVIVNNGVPSGTIQLWYTVVANQFTCGPFATFNLGLVDQAGGGHNGVYPATLTLQDEGNGTGAQLAPDPGTFNVNGVGWNDSSTVTVNIVSCPTNGHDGDDIVGNLDESIPGNNHIDTITKVQVHIRLSVPSGACLKLYSLESDASTFDVLTSVGLTEHCPHAGGCYINATQPGQIDVDGLLANTCATAQTFDLAINLGSLWDRNPSNTHGNATFVYTTAGTYDPDTYGTAVWGTGSPQGETLCVESLTLNPGDSLLTTVHAALIGNPLVTSLPTTPPGFPFYAQVYNPGSGCVGSTTVPVGPTNPANTALTYTVTN